jgi:quinol monooxygenase YgiN
VITVSFRLKPGSREVFRRHMDANARASARDEPGCRRFDVLEPAGDPDSIFLYEIYDDRAAFQEHVRSAHFAEFQAVTADLVAEKVVVEYDLVCQGGANCP